MLALKPQVRYSLRASVLFTAMLALWWLELRTPMLFLLRVSESVALRLLANSNSTEPIAVDAAGDWNFRVPVEDTNGAVKFRAIEFTMARPDLVLFTFSVPVFWAMVLAAPLGRSGIRALIWGTALVALIEVLSLLAQVEMTAYGAAAELHLSADGLAEWSRNFGNRLVIGVVPFAAPVLAAVGLHRELRSQIFTYSVPKRGTPRA